MLHLSAISPPFRAILTWDAGDAHPPRFAARRIIAGVFVIVLVCLCVRRNVAMRSAAAARSASLGLTVHQRALSGMEAARVVRSPRDPYPAAAGAAGAAAAAGGPRRRQGSAGLDAQPSGQWNNNTVSPCMHSGLGLWALASGPWRQRQRTAFARAWILL